MISLPSAAARGFEPRSNNQLLQDFLVKSEAGAPGAPSVSEIKSRHRYWSILGKQTANGSKYTVKS